MRLDSAVFALTVHALQYRNGRAARASCSTLLYTQKRTKAGATTRRVASPGPAVWRGQRKLPSVKRGSTVRRLLALEPRRGAPVSGAAEALYGLVLRRHGGRGVEAGAKRATTRLAGCERALPARA